MNGPIHLLALLSPDITHSVSFYTPNFPVLSDGLVDWTAPMKIMPGKQRSRPLLFCVDGSFYLKYTFQFLCADTGGTLA